MGFLSRFFGRIPFDTTDAARRVLPDPHEPFVGLKGGLSFVDPGVPLGQLVKGDVEAIWGSQHNVRKVVDFIARNLASIPLNVYNRAGDNNRERVHDGDLARVVKTPQNRLGAFRFWHSVYSDWLLYDRWAVLIVERGGRHELVQLPSHRVEFELDDLRRVAAVWFWKGENNGRAHWVKLPFESVVFDYGYAPNGAGESPLTALSDVLSEASESVQYRRQVWANGGRMSQYVHRPESAPGWSPGAAQQFMDSLRDGYSREGSQAGGIPLLEDGMELRDVRRLASVDAMDLEGRKLSAVEVASAFHIPPELVGAREGNYSNLREHRQALYRDSLGPYIEAIEDVLNAQLVPSLASGTKFYVEANVESKLRGDFIEQAGVKQSATGAPWLTRNEARALENRPPVAGGDELVVPLNVLVGGMASPRDSGSQNRTGAASREVSVKAPATSGFVDRAQDVFSKFFARQGQAVKSRLGVKAPAWWDHERWDDELADDLYRFAVMVSKSVAESVLESVGFGPDEYDVSRTLDYLKVVTKRIAGQVNLVTFAQLEAALEDDEDVSGAVSHVFEVAESSRAEQSGTTVTTTVVGFATAEAGKQVGGSRARKRWVVNSGNPRASHAAMDGETVGIDEDFSNGMPFPGTFGDPDEVAGCQCSIEVIFPN